MYNTLDRVSFCICISMTVLVFAIYYDHTWLSGVAWLAGASLMVWGVIGNTPNVTLRVLFIIWVAIFSGILLAVTIFAPIIWFTPFVIFMTVRALTPLVKTSLNTTTPLQ